MLGVKNLEFRINNQQLTINNQLHIVGIGIEGLEGLSSTARKELQRATLITGSANNLQHVIDHKAQKLVLDKDLEAWISKLKQLLKSQSILVLASGDPLFFGIGRLLTENFSSESLRFYPHVSSVQLAFSRLCIPWQSATVVSVHGRSPEQLVQVLRKGLSPLAVLTDGVYNPSAIAQLIQDLYPPVNYKLWVCSQLGSTEEEIEGVSLDEAITRTFPVPNVVVLEKVETTLPQQPLLGIPDNAFYTFDDQPGLLTKQEVRVLSLSLLRLTSGIIVWDIGAGTGSISIEIGRLVPDANIFAIEQKAAGVALIRRNCDRFSLENVKIISGIAPEALANLPSPDRIMLSGGGRRIPEILAVCSSKLKPGGVLVANFATLEACSVTKNILREQNFALQMLQVNIARSTTLKANTPQAIDATRFFPLNPVTILQGIKDI